MAHPYLAASRRSAGTGSSGYQSLRPSAQPVPKAKPSALDAAVAETSRSPEQRMLDAILDRAARPFNQGALEDAIAQGHQRRAGPSTAERLARVRLPKINPLPLARLFEPGTVLGMANEMLQMALSRQASTAAVRNHSEFTGWSFWVECAPVSGYSTDCHHTGFSLSSCLSLQGMSAQPGDCAGVGLPSDITTFATWGLGVISGNDRFATLHIFRKNSGGGLPALRGEAQPHAARPARLRIFAPNVSNTGIRKVRPERKWFPEIERPLQWSPAPAHAPWVWLRHRAQYNPMRAPSEQSQRGPSVKARPDPMVSRLPAPRPALQTNPLLVFVSPPGPPTRLRPPPGTRESKQQVKGTRLILKAVNVLTEGFDYLDAFYDALPKHCKRTRSQRGLRQMRPQHKLEAVAMCWRELSWKEVIKNLIENEVEDRVFGGIGQGLNKLNRSMGRPVGVQTGVGSPGKVPKGTQMGKKPWDNWTDYIWP